jgi:hypothetical protein
MKMHRLLWRVGFLPFRFFDPKFDFKRTKYDVETYYLINKFKNRRKFLLTSYLPSTSRARIISSYTCLHSKNAKKWRVSIFKVLIPNLVFKV